MNVKEKNQMFGYMCYVPFMIALEDTYSKQGNIAPVSKAIKSDWVVVLHWCCRRSGGQKLKKEGVRLLYLECYVEH